MMGPTKSEMERLRDRLYWAEQHFDQLQAAFVALTDQACGLREALLESNRRRRELKAEAERYMEAEG